MSLVYVQSKNGTPLIPTHNNRMVRLLLKEGRAKVVARTPFTIRLLVTVNTYKLSEKEARKFAEECLEVDEYEQIFGEIEE